MAPQRFFLSAAKPMYQVTTAAEAATAVTPPRKWTNRRGGPRRRRCSTAPRLQSPRLNVAAASLVLLSTLAGRRLRFLPQIFVSSSTCSGWWRTYVVDRPPSPPEEENVHPESTAQWDWRNDDWWNPDNPNLQMFDGYIGRTNSICKSGDPALPDVNVAAWSYDQTRNFDAWRFVRDVDDCREECDKRGGGCTGFELSNKENYFASNEAQRCDLWKARVDYMVHDGSSAASGETSGGLGVHCYRKLSTSSSPEAASDSVADVVLDQEVPYEIQPGSTCRYDANRRSENLGGPIDPAVIDSHGGMTPYYDVYSNVLSFSECKRKCTGRSDCKGFEHDPSRKRCEVWTTVVGYAVSNAEGCVCAFKVTEQTKDNVDAWNWWRSDGGARAREFVGGGETHTSPTSSFELFVWAWQGGDDKTAIATVGPSTEIPNGDDSTTADNVGKFVFNGRSWRKEGTEPTATIEFDSPWVDDGVEFGIEVDWDENVYENLVDWKEFSWYCDWSVKLASSSPASTGSDRRLAAKTHGHSMAAASTSIGIRGGRRRLSQFFYAPPVQQTMQETSAAVGKTEVVDGAEPSAASIGPQTMTTQLPPLVNDEMLALVEVAIQSSREVLESEAFLESERNVRWELLNTTQKKVCDAFDIQSFKTDVKVIEKCLAVQGELPLDVGQPSEDTCDTKVELILAAEYQEFKKICSEQREERKSFAWGYYQKNLNLKDRCDEVQRNIEDLLMTIEGSLQAGRDAGTRRSLKSVQEKEHAIQTLNSELQAQEALEAELSMKIENAREIKEASLCLDISGIEKLMTADELKLFDVEVSKALQWSFMKDGQEMDVLGAYGTVQSEMTDITEEVTNASDQVNRRTLESNTTRSSLERTRRTRRRARYRTKVVLRSDGTCMRCITSGERTSLDAAGDGQRHRRQTKAGRDGFRGRRRRTKGKGSKSKGKGDTSLEDQTEFFVTTTITTTTTTSTRSAITAQTAAVTIVANSPSDVQAASPTLSVIVRTKNVLLYDTERIYAGQTIYLESQDAFLRQNEDGTLTLYDGAPTDEGKALPYNDVLWSNSHSSAGNDDNNVYFSHLQDDGHLLTKDEADGNAWVWKTNVFGNVGYDYFFALKEDKSEVFVAKGTPEKSGDILWSEATSYQELMPKLILFEDQRIHIGHTKYVDGAHLEARVDGNIVLFRDNPTEVLWETSTGVFGNDYYITLERNGSLKAKRTSDEETIWETGGNSAFGENESHYLALIVGADGRPKGMAVYAGAVRKRIIWSSLEQSTATQFPTVTTVTLEQIHATLEPQGAPPPVQGEEQGDVELGLTVRVKNDYGEEEEVDILEYRMKKVLLENFKESFPRRNAIELLRIPCNSEF